MALLSNIIIKLNITKFAKQNICTTSDIFIVLIIIKRSLHKLKGYVVFISFPYNKRLVTYIHHLHITFHTWCNCLSDFLLICRKKSHITILHDYSSLTKTKGDYIYLAQKANFHDCVQICLSINYYAAPMYLSVHGEVPVDDSSTI